MRAADGQEVQAGLEGVSRRRPLGRIRKRGETMNVRGKVVIVTGASAGIGLATVRPPR
jgi:hypothetical protein